MRIDPAPAPVPRVSRTLLLAGADVLRIGLGTNRLTRSADHVTFIRDAVAAGITHIDTAHLYTDGASEASLGEALEGITETCIVATKGGYGRGEGRPQVLIAQIEESLRRLRREAIDLYYLHRVDPITPLEESLGAIRGCMDAGMIRHAGLSAVTVEQIERAQLVLPVTAVQNHYNIAERSHENVIDHCTQHGIVFVPYFPLRETRPIVQRIAALRGVTPSQVTLACLLHRSRVTLPIPGTLSLTHLSENIGALDIELTDAEVSDLQAAA
jgi:aryl-alcohol dehydrogenase-like predicted oxidoreductase